MYKGRIKSWIKTTWKLVSDPRYRRATRVDDGLSKFISEHGGYVLRVGRVPE